PYDKITCKAPLRTVAHKLGLNCVDFDLNLAKESETEFTKIFSTKNSSVLLCKPKTGRTHQIRVHLQYLGYPIANDPLYCNPSIWGPDLGIEASIPDRNFSEIYNPSINPLNLPKNTPKIPLKHFDTKGHEIVATIDKPNANNSPINSSHDLAADASRDNIPQLNSNSSTNNPINSKYQPIINNLLDQIKTGSLTEFSRLFDKDYQNYISSISNNSPSQTAQNSNPNSQNISHSENTLLQSNQEDQTPCSDCGAIEYNFPKTQSELMIWLHALKYSGSNWEFETEMPLWASKDFEPNIPPYLLQSASILNK
ncbi:hypothetical protein AYI70_g4819, partial [Smittium culicis]